MIVRTPLPKKRRPEATGNSDSPNSDGRFVIFEDLPEPEPSHQHSDQMLCTYQCRQLVKADFLDALGSAEKKSQDYQSKLEAMDSDLRKSEAERMKFRDQLLYAEQEVAAAKGREQALQDQLLKEVSESQERLRKQIHIHSELEVKFRKEMELRKKAESLLSSAEEKANLLEGKLSHVSESIEREKVRLQKELTQLKQESKLSMQRISADLQRMECKASNSEKEAAMLKEQLENLQTKLNECLHEKNEVEKKLSTLTHQEFPSDDNILVKHLREELRNYESEVREARKWKASHEDIELLREKLLEEKGCRERAESEVLKLSEAQINGKKLEDELSSWKSIIKDIPGVTSAADIPLKFEALQKEVLEGMMKMGEVTARLKQVEVALDVAENTRQNVETEFALTNEKMELLKLELKRTQLLLSSTTEERDRLKIVVDQLKQQKTVEAGGAMTDGTVKELEASLAMKEDLIKQLESSIQEQKDVNTRQHSEIKLLNERLSNESRRIKSLEREDDRLRSEIAILESKLGHGDFSSASTKVLRMVNSLAVDSEAKQTIEALQNELQKTKDKLQAIEELKKQSGDAGTLVDSYISGKVVQLKEQIATLEKREERYKAVFADRISVFRRACCELFGYKIVMDDHQRSDGIPVTRFTLQSIYAQSDDEKLQFEYESGNTKVLGNNYTQQPDISHQVEIFIRKLNSIPAFTANLTVESFNKRTLS
ncbi:putative spindle assembly checkpoint component Mad1 [Helianthus annuus]|nr:putative spindle assembly checkpoint component Mad1 [Helianthus annuus]KAJ0696881.1 putative spindle assembly checkpoint component Mad1 [Helianthus annuus]KAJ0879628.1 putative spindle assembly checkpoint component Mad1 [Helianthus annuus]